MSGHLLNTYARLPVAFVRGEGAWLFDSSERRYLDAISGLGVTALGHAHPAVAEVIADQARTLMHTSNMYQIPWQDELGDRLARISGLDQAFIANSGTETIECALKMVRLAGHARGIDTPGVVVMEHSFHGRTLAALSATGSRKVQAGFEPLVGGFVRVPFDDLEAVAKAGRSDPSIAAVLVEPIQGESGVRLPSPGYLSGLRQLCDQYGWLLIFDEIQCGLCRTGRWYTYQHENALPDILTSAKALANGLPIGACLARGEAAQLLKPGQHGSTFGGNPLASRTACRVIDLMDELGLAQQAEQRGAWLLENLREQLAGREDVHEVRGLGLMLAVELRRPAAPVRDQALANGLLVNATRETVIRLLPPLIIDEAESGQLVERLVSAIEATGE